jgi:type I restriction enzyme S subunit
MSSEVARFGDLFSEPQRNGLTRPKKVRGSGFPMVNMGELFAYPRIRNISMDLVPIDVKEHHYLLEAGDLLFARQSLVLSGAGQCSIFLGNDAPTVFESHLIRCRLNPIRSNPLFYFYFFRSPDGRRVIEAIVEQGAGASGIRGSDLVNVQVPNPPKQIQDEVAGLLGSIDDRITLLRETNTTLEAIAQALFKSWFVDFDPVHAKMQGLAPEGIDEATAALFPDSFEESELGDVPKGWQVMPIGDAVEAIGGASRAPLDDP